MVQGRIENGEWMRMTNGTRTVLETIVLIVLYQNIFTNFSFYPSHKQIYCTKEKQIFFCLTSKTYILFDIYIYIYTVEVYVCIACPAHCVLILERELYQISYFCFFTKLEPRLALLRAVLLEAADAARGLALPAQSR
jgi:hypothetical protein